QGFRLSQDEGNITQKNNKNSGSTQNQHQTAVKMQGAHLMSSVANNKQQNQHPSRKLSQDFCVQASHSNRPNNNSASTPNLEQQPSNTHFRLSYDEGNVPCQNHKKCAPTQNQHQTTGDQSDKYLPKNCEKEKNCIQPQTIQTNSVMMQGEHSAPVCMHEPKFECEDCQKQCEQQLRNKSVPYTIQQKSDENC
ncbi:MAG: hypothetical protein GY820_40965, partial [Gammaproteobacteria bacterium]|nr:hypothetical protein [Gammaproteobacteria bacterium]